MCHDTGWTFVAFSDSEVRQEPIFSNIKLLYRYARENFGIEQYRDCMAIISSQVPASLADIYHILDCRKIPRNVLFKSLFCCLIKIALKQPIQLDSAIAPARSQLSQKKLIGRDC